MITYKFFRHGLYLWFFYGLFLFEIGWDITEDYGLLKVILLHDTITWFWLFKIQVAKFVMGIGIDTCGDWKDRIQMRREVKK